MSDAAPPPLPFPTPPSIERAVNEHLDVVHEMRELRREMNVLTANHARMANEASVDRLTLGRVESKLDRLLKHLGVRNG